MTKRDFLKSLGITLVGAAAGFAEPRRRPKNWVWVAGPPRGTQDDWHHIFDRLNARGIEAAAVEMFDGRRAYPLDTILRVSRRHAVEVHAWLRLGADAAPARVRRLVAQLADVPTLIGIHLDLGATGKRVAKDADWPRWTELVAGAVRVARPRGTAITAAVPVEASRHWSAWPLDGFVPVVAEQDEPENVTRHMEQVVAAASAPAYCGLAARTMAPDVLARVVRAALAGGAAGVSLFDLAGMDDARWTAFEQAVALG